MKFLSTIMLAVLPLFFVACDKKLHGTVLDNFGTPVSGVSIKIKDSGYSTESSGGGTFKMEYAAGKFEVAFEKEGFLNANRKLELSEKAKFDLGTVSMIKLPDTSAVFIKSMADYHRIPLCNMKVKDVVVPKGYTSVQVKVFSLNPDSVETIELSSLDSLEVINSLDRDVHLAKADEDGIVAMVMFFPGFFENSSEIKGEKVEEKVSKLGSSLWSRKFLPKKDEVYVYFSYDTNYNTNRIIMSDDFFAFKVKIAE